MERRHFLKSIGSGGLAAAAGSGLALPGTVKADTEGEGVAQYIRQLAQFNEGRVHLGVHYGKLGDDTSTKYVWLTMHDHEPFGKESGQIFLGAASTDIEFVNPNDYTVALLRKDNGKIGFNIGGEDYVGHSLLMGNGHASSLYEGNAGNACSLELMLGGKTMQLEGVYNTGDNQLARIYGKITRNIEWGAFGR